MSNEDLNIEAITETDGGIGEEIEVDESAIELAEDSDSYEDND